MQILSRQINFIVKFFSKTLIWRNFCEKTVAVKFQNFHSVMQQSDQKLKNFREINFDYFSVIFTQKFREINTFPSELFS